MRFQYALQMRALTLQLIQIFGCKLLAEFFYYFFLFFLNLEGYETELYYNRTFVLLVLIVGTNLSLFLNTDDINIYFYGLHELAVSSEYR
jgi:hypothetical protein